jgi:hypothetical protein
MSELRARHLQSSSSSSSSSTTHTETEIELTTTLETHSETHHHTHIQTHIHTHSSGAPKLTNIGRLSLVFGLCATAGMCVWSVQSQGWQEWSWECRVGILIAQFVYSCLWAAFAVPKLSQDQRYHDFADKRNLCCGRVPNSFDVLVSVPVCLLVSVVNIVTRSSIVFLPCMSDSLSPSLSRSLSLLNSLSLSLELSS